MSKIVKVVLQESVKQKLPVVLLVPKDMVSVRRAGIAVTSNGYSLKNTVSVLRNNVVELVGHTARARDVGNTEIGYHKLWSTLKHKYV